MINNSNILEFFFSTNIQNAISFIEKGEDIPENLSRMILNDLTLHTNTLHSILSNRSKFKKLERVLNSESINSLREYKNEMDLIKAYWTYIVEGNSPYQNIPSSYKVEIGKLFENIEKAINNGIPDCYLLYSTKL